MSKRKRAHSNPIHNIRNVHGYYFITGLAIVIFWRGAWGLLDLYFFPGDPLMSYVFSAVLGMVVLYLNDFSLSELAD